jgi:integrase
MKTLDEQEATAILHELFQEMLKELERLRWASFQQDREKIRAEWESEVFGEYDELAFEYDRSVSEREINEYRTELARSNYQRTALEARQALERFGFAWEPDSAYTRYFCAELAKQRIIFNEVILARTEGDFRREEELLGATKSTDALALPDAESPSTISLAAAWDEYVQEKTAARPTPDWSENTAAGQMTTMSELLEIVGDRPITQVNRELMARYLEVVSRLPKNRKKSYADHSIESLLSLELPASSRPSPRTIKEKLTQVGSFLKWCREIKGYLQDDPLRGLSVKAESRSYAPFNQDDLKALFESIEYLDGQHRRCWQFWVPLIALYTGARQAEIAQLKVSDVLVEDNIELINISDSSEDQRVKTPAAIRKVPINQQLKSIGFLDYVAWLKERDVDRLFPDLTPGKRSAGQKISRWFGDTYKRRCGIKADATGGRKVFHSFRHTAITKALGAGIAVQYCQQFFGHEKSILGETATYTHQFSPQTLVAVADALDWGLDHRSYQGGWESYVTSWDIAERR